MGHRYLTAGEYYVVNWITKLVVVSLKNYKPLEEGELAESRRAPSILLFAFHSVHSFREGITWNTVIWLILTYSSHLGQVRLAFSSFQLIYKHIQTYLTRGFGTALI